MASVEYVVQKPDLSWLQRLGHRGFLLRQNVDWLGIALDDDFQANKYQIKPFPDEYQESDGPLSDHDFKALPLTFVAIEHSDVWYRCCCGPNRPFEMSVIDHIGGGKEYLRIKRELKWPPHVFCGLFPVCGCFLVPQEAEIFTTEGYKLGSVVESHHNCVCAPSWFMDIRDSDGSTRYIAKAWVGQCGPNICCQSYTFEIMTPQMDETGATIRNIFPGCTFRGLFSRADNLMVTFPEDATAEDRALIMGAAFLADYVYFEKLNNNKATADTGVTQPLLGH